MQSRLNDDEYFVDNLLREMPQDLDTTSGSFTMWHWSMWVLDSITSPYVGMILAVLVIIGLHFKDNIISSFVARTFGRISLAIVIDSSIAMLDMLWHACSQGVFVGLPGAVFRRGVKDTEQKDCYTDGIPGLGEIGCITEEDTALMSVSRPSVEFRTGDFDHLATSCDEIEPAFLQDKDYPPKWMIYHCVLGVVPKDEVKEGVVQDVR